MKFTCERDAVISEISIAQEIISSKNVLSILSNVLLSVEEGKLLMKATDMSLVKAQTRLATFFTLAENMSIIIPVKD